MIHPASFACSFIHAKIFTVVSWHDTPRRVQPYKQIYEPMFYKLYERFRMQLENYHAGIKTLRRARDHTLLQQSDDVSAGAAWPPPPSPHQRSVNSQLRGSSDTWHSNFGSAPRGDGSELHSTAAETLQSAEEVVPVTWLECCGMTLKLLAIHGRAGVTRGPPEWPQVGSNK